MSQNLDTYTTITLAAGASTTVAHGLEDSSGGLVPNIILPDRNTSIAVVSATSTSVTFTNAGASSATAKFWIQHQFSMQENDTSTLFWAGGGSSTGGGGGGIYVLDPSGTAGGNVYTSWASLYAALPDAGDPRKGSLIVVANDATAAAGTYNIDGLRFLGLAGGAGQTTAAPTLLWTQETTLTFSTLMLQDIGFTFDNDVATVATIAPGTSSSLVVLKNAHMFTLGSQPILTYDGNGTNEMILDGASTSGYSLSNSGSGPSIVNLLNGAVLLITMYDDAYIDIDCLANDVTSGFQIYAAGPSTPMYPTQTGASGIGFNRTAVLSEQGSARRNLPTKNSFAITNNLLVPVALKNDTTTFAIGNDWGPLAETAATLALTGQIMPTANAFVASGVLAGTLLTSSAVVTSTNTAMGVYGEVTTAAVVADEVGVVSTVASQSYASGGVHWFRFSLPDVTGTRFFVGLTDQVGANRSNTTASDTPAGNYVGLQFFTTRGDTAYRFVVRDSGGTQVLSTNLTNATPSTTAYLLMIDMRNQPTSGTGTIAMRLWRWDASAWVVAEESGSTTHVFSVLSTTGAFSNAASTGLGPCLSVTSTGGSARRARLGFASVNLGLRREML